MPKLAEHAREGTEQHDVLLAVQEVELAEVLDDLLPRRALEGEVELLQGLSRREVGRLDPVRAAMELPGTEWVGAPGRGEALRSSRLSCAGCLSCMHLLVVDEVGYIPFDPETANLMFSLVSAHYERASLIVTSNKPFSAWGRSSATKWSPRK